MSGWLWKKPEPKKPTTFEEYLNNPENPGGLPPPGGAASGGGDSGGNGRQPPQTVETKYTGFDPTGLEKAVKYMRELEKSKHAKDALAVTLSQEETRKKEAEANIKQFEHSIQQEESNKIRVIEDERRKTMKEQQRYNQQNEQYKDRLARKRHDDQLEQNRANNEEILRRQEESTRKQELMRRETVEYQEKLRHENEMRRVAAEVKAKGKMERENHDLIKEKIKLEQKEKRETNLQMLSSAANLIGTGIDTILTNRDKAYALVGTVFGCALAIYGAKHGMISVARYIEARIGKPTLVRETSRYTAKDSLKHPIATIRRMFEEKKDALEGVVTDAKLEKRLKSLSASTYFTKQNNGTYRNLLMYGPPGTGKTLFAKKLAQSSGMDYAILTGGDIAPMGKEGVTAIHKVFDWSNTSKRGLLLFVDEADAFLRKRTEGQMSEDMRSTLNAFLYRTGESSKNFMLVMASNRPDHLDWAINDRLDEMVEFPLPGLEERERMLHLYINQYITSLVDKGDIETEEFDLNEVVHDVATQLEGFSGREISKLSIALQASVFGSPDKTFRREMINDRVSESLASNKQKALWTKDEYFVNAV